MNKKTILIFIAYYEPGFKSGGPIRSISNLTKHLGSEINFKIITRDRDKEDTKSYEHIKVNDWNTRDRCEVFYASKGFLFFFRITRLLLKEYYDTVYINSFFSFSFSIFPTVVRKIFHIKNKFIIAPRGEFSPGALNLKQFKKILYIMISKIINLHKDFIWQSTNKLEKNNIHNIFKNAKIEIADMISCPGCPNQNIPLIKKMGSLKLIFLSRISPKKNLFEALKILSKVTGNIDYDIYGVIEDKKYWKSCQDFIRKLPNNIRVNYRGAPTPNEVLSIFSQYDLFFFLTHGENYGHVIIESLMAGCPVLLSNTTPWYDIENFKAGRVIDLLKEEDFIRELEKWIAMDHDEHSMYRKNAQAYAQLKSNLSATLDQYRKLL